MKQLIFGSIGHGKIKPERPPPQPTHHNENQTKDNLGALSTWRRCLPRVLSRRRKSPPAYLANGIWCEMEQRTQTLIKIDQTQTWT